MCAKNALNKNKEEKMKIKKKKSKNINWEKLKVFLSVANFQSIKKAAIFCDMSPTVFVRQVSDLEEELGVQLFTRSRIGSFLTEDGEALLPIVQRMSFDLENYVKIRENPETISQKAISVAANPFVGTYILSTPLSLFAKENPNISVSLIFSKTDAHIFKTKPDLHFGTLREIGKQENVEIHNFLEFHNRKFVHKSFNGNLKRLVYVDKEDVGEFFSSTSEDVKEELFFKVDSVQAALSAATVGLYPIFCCDLADFITDKDDFSEVPGSFKEKKDLFVEVKKSPKENKDIELFLDFLETYFDSKKENGHKPINA